MWKSFALASLVVSGCSQQRLPALQPQVSYGPAAQITPRRVLVLQASCGSVVSRCPKEYRETVDAIVRSGLEFAGYGVVDSDSLRLATRARHEEHTTASSTTATAGTSSFEVVHPLIVIDEKTDWATLQKTDQEITFIALDGSNFEDLSVDDKHEVIAKANTDSVASVRIIVGGNVGVWQPNQNVEVMVKLNVNRGDEMARAARCTASSNDFTTVGAALEHAARCTMHGLTAAR